MELTTQLSLQQATELDAQIKQGVGMEAIRLYMMYEGNGYKRLGFSDFGEYMESREIKSTTGYNRVKQVEMSIAVGRISITAMDETKLLPQSVAWELNKLKTDPQRLAVWEECATVSEANQNDPITDDAVRVAIKRRVKSIVEPPAREVKQKTFVNAPANVVSEGTDCEAISTHGNESADDGPTDEELDEVMANMRPITKEEFIAAVVEDTEDDLPGTIVFDALPPQTVVTSSYEPPALFGADNPPFRLKRLYVQWNTFCRIHKLLAVPSFPDYLKDHAE